MRRRELLKALVIVPLAAACKCKGDPEIPSRPQPARSKDKVAGGTVTGRWSSPRMVGEGTTCMVPLGASHQPLIDPGKYRVGGAFFHETVYIGPSEPWRPGERLARFPS